MKMNLSNVLLLPGFFVLFALICSAEVSRLVQTMRESRHESERERKNPHWCSYALGATKSSIVRPGPAGFSSLFFASPALYMPRERGTPPWESGYFVTRRRLKSLSANLVWESRVLLCSPAGEISLCGIALHTLWLGERHSATAGNTLWRPTFCQRIKLNIYTLGWHECCAQIPIIIR